MSRLVRADINTKGHFRMGSGQVSVLAAVWGPASTLEAKQLRGAPFVGKPVAATAGETVGVTQVDDFASRIVKYVPAEVIAFYLAADKLFLSPATNIPGLTPNTATAYINGHLEVFSVAVFFVAFIAVAPYIRSQADENQPWIVNAVMSTVAFVILAYVANGSIFFQQGGYYDPRLAGLLVLVFTLLSGFVIPGKGQPSEPDK